MADSPSFDRLLSGLQKGDTDQIAELIVKRFESRLAFMAADRISRKLGRRIEVDDVTQSAFATFFRRVDDGRIELVDWDSLWGMLAKIARRRICRHAERNGAGKRSLDREIALAEDAAAFDREPSAEEVLGAEELSQGLIDQFPEKHQEMLRGILAGKTHEEIAKELGTSIATVERVRRRARELLGGMISEEA